MCFPLSPFPHELVSSCNPPVPNPILELQVLQELVWSPRIPILALEYLESALTALNPSLLHLDYKEASEPISDFHVSRPSEVLRYCPSAIREYKEFACLLMTIRLIWLLIFIPRQILEKDVFQQEGSLVSCESNPVFPPSRLKVSLLLQRVDL